MSVGTRVHVVLGLIAATLVWSVNAPAPAAAEPRTPAAVEPTHDLVGGVEVPSNLSEITSVADVASDVGGNIYFGHTTTGGGFHIYKSSPAGVLTNFAGNGSDPAVVGDGSLAVAVGLAQASSLATDSGGNLYFFDGSRIRKVTAGTGTISTVAGNGTVAATAGAGDGSVATSIGLPAYLGDIAVDSSGNVYYVEPNYFSGGGVVRKVTASNGILSTVLGVTTGFSNCASLTGPTANVRFDNIGGLAIDALNNLYADVYCYGSTNPLVEYGYRILKLTPDGQSSVVVGGGTGLLTDGAGATTVRLNGDQIHASSSGEIYFVSNSVVYKTAGGVITRITNVGASCAFVDGASSSDLCVSDLVLLPSGALGVLGSYPDYGYGVLSSGVLDVMTQPMDPPNGVDARHSTLPSLSDLAVNPDGTVFFASGTSAPVRSISPSFLLGTKAGNGTYGNPVFGGLATSTAVPDIGSLDTDAGGNLFMVSHSYPSVMKVTTDGVLERVAGTGVFDDGPDGGQATQTPVRPDVVAVSGNGDTYFTTSEYRMCGGSYCQVTSLRRVSSSTGALSTVVGSSANFLVDDLAVSPTGSVILARNSTDTELLQVNANTGEATSVASISGLQGGTKRVAVDAAGNVFVADGSALWKMTTTGAVTKVATILDAASGYWNPVGLDIDASGNVYVVSGDRVLKYPGLAAASNVVAAIADDDAVHALSGVAIDIDVNANDVITSGTLAAPTITVAPTSGSATVSPSGHISYTPQAGFVGTDSFKYSVCGTSAQAAICDTATVSVSVVAALPTVAATHDSASLVSDATVDVDVLANDTTTSGTLARPTVTVASIHGATGVLASGAIRYTAAANYVGPDTLTYSVCSQDYPTSCSTNTISFTVTLAPGSISGSVTTGPSTPLTSGLVAAFVGTNAYPSASATIKADGTYTFPALAAGSYKLVAYPPSGSAYATQAYSGAYTLATATAITVADGDALTGKDFTLATGGTITGTVTNTAATALSNACVSLSGAPLPSYYYSNTYACTNASGVYTFSGLAPGNYTLYFSKSDVSPVYIAEYYNDKISSVNADPVAVTLGNTSHADAQLSRQGSISGSVTDAVTIGVVTSGRVDAFSGTSTYPAASAYVGSDGSYVFSSLAPGSYKLVFYPAAGSGYAPQAYSGAGTLAAATAVTVTAGATSTGKNFVVAIGGKITGTITDGDGVALANACVSVSNAPLPPSYYGTSTVCTNSSGNYTINELAAGSYVLQFSKTGVVPGYAAEYYNNKTYANPDAVAVTLGQTKENIDVSLSRNSMISGQLTDAGSGAAVPSSTSIQITAVDTTSSVAFYGYSSYSTPGTYSLELPPGTYKVSASNYGAVYATQYYSNKASIALADSVTTTAGVTRTIDFALARNPAIRGTVASAAGLPIQGVTVAAYSASNSSYPVVSATTAADGTYSLLAAAGNYVLKATDSAGGFISEWYADATSFDSASIVSLGTSDIVANFSLAPGGSFTGTVTRAGIAVSYASVNIYKNGQYLGYVNTDSLGRYTSPGLAAGNYTAESGGIYYDAETYANATSITVTVSHVTTGIDFALPVTGISGTVTDEATSLPIANAQVALYQNQNAYSTYLTYTQSDGTYTFNGIAAGTYKVFASAGGHQSEFYDNKATLAEATPITVTTTALTGYNLALAPSAPALIGTISDDQTHAAISACVRAVESTTFAQTQVCTGSDGKYALNVPPGSYSLEFTAAGYVKKLLNGPFVVTSSSSTTSDVEMSFGGTISGTVIDQQSLNPLSGVCLQLLDAATNNYTSSYTCTSSTGVFSFTGLAAGSYKIYASSAGRYVREYFDNASDAASATAVPVTLGHTVSGLSVGLTLGGSVAGTVTSGGSPVANACVDALNLAGDTVLATACTNASGAYQLDGIPAGSVKVRFSASGFASQFWNGVATVGSATAISVTAGATTPAINAALVALSNTPTNVVATAGAAQATVTWTAPSAPDSPITDYRVEYSSDSGATWTIFNHNASTTTSALVTGLTNGSSYIFRVTALSDVVVGTASAPSAAVVPSTLPGAPTAVSGAPSNASVAVSWLPPSSTGGSPVTKYVVTSTPGSLTCETAGALTCTVSGLTNGAAYTFGVVATNANGPGPSSSSAVVTPRTVAGAPAAPTGIAGDAKVTLSWTAPVTTGGAAISDYKVEYSADNGTTWATFADAVSSTTGAIVNVLVNGHPYVFRVSAINAAGVGPASPPSAVITPNGPLPVTVPGAPTSVAGTPGDSSVTVTWVAPASNGGAAITKYVVTASPGAATCQTTGSVSCPVTGLVNGTAYVFSVKATNSIGAGGAGSSAPVTPRTVPGAPTSVAGTPGDSSVAVTWAAPASNGGAVITKYVVTASPGGAICETTGALSCVVAGLVNDAAYTFGVTATNAAGAGASGSSGPVTPHASAVDVGATVPGAPRSVTATAGDAQATVSWTAPAADGGATISEYVVVASPGGATCQTTGALSCIVTGLSNGTAYTFSVVATNSAGSGAAGASAAVTPQAPAPEPPFDPLPSPGRLLDTRSDGTTADGQAEGVGTNAAGTTLDLVVAGRAGVPLDASSVILNVTVVDAQAPGFVTVWPCGVDRPNASNLNFVNGQTVPNAVISKIGTGGRVCLYSSATVGLVVDVAGFFPSETAFTSLTSPARLLDTRAGQTTLDGLFAGGGASVGGTVLELPITGRAGVPATAASMVLNVTVVAPVAAGFVTVFPCGAPRPNASNLNFVAGQVIPNAVVTKVGDSGRVCLYSNVTTDLLVDAAGYFGSEKAFKPLDAPARLLDTRPGMTTVDGSFAGAGPLAGGSEIHLQVAGRAGVDGDAPTVVLNVTAVDPSAAGFVTVYPCGVTRPTASNLNFTAGQTIPNAVISKVGAAGQVCLYSNVTTGLIVDVAGTLG